MHLKKAPVLILLVWKLMCLEADGEKACSCYTFESGQSKTWRKARASCKYNKKDLVAMETEREWQFITNELKNRTAKYNEWHIGLFWSRTVSNWTWVKSKPLTIKKWGDSDTRGSSYYAVIVKEWLRGSYGKFEGIRGDIKRAWICEEETDTCQGVCMRHYPSVTTIVTPRVTAATTKERTSFSIADPTNFSSDFTTLASPSSLSERKTAKKDSTLTLVIVAASLGTALFIALIALTFALLVLVRLRRQHSSKDSSSEIAERIQLENQGSSLSAAQYTALESSRMSGKNGDGRHELEATTRQPRRTDCEYTMLSQCTMTPSERVYASLTTASESPIYVNQIG